MLLSKILLLSHALSVWFARKKSELYLRGAVYNVGFASFYLILAISVYIISVLPFTLHRYVLMSILLLYTYVIFYGGYKRYILREIKRRKIISTFEQIDDRMKKRYAYLGLLLMILSFILLHVSCYANIQGYFNR
jgi:hypothetical protein